VDDEVRCVELRGSVNRRRSELGSERLPLKVPLKEIAHFRFNPTMFALLLDLPLPLSTTYLSQSAY